MTQMPQHFEAQITQDVRLDYLVYLPPGYGSEPDQRWPLILYLHGAGARGNDLNLLKQNGIPYALENGLELPFIVISPQCPADSHWTLHIEALNALLDDVSVHYYADEKRICSTGASMGAAGAWMLAGAYPERFAALAPISGRIVPLPLWRMKDLAIWAFHGEADDAVPVSEAQRTVDALKAIGGNVKLTIYPGVGHNLAAQIYDKPELYAWLLSQIRS